MGMVLRSIAKKATKEIAFKYRNYGFKDEASYREAADARYGSIVDLTLVLDGAVWDAQQYIRLDLAEVPVIGRVVIRIIYNIGMGWHLVRVQKYDQPE